MTHEIRGVDVEKYALLCQHTSINQSTHTQAAGQRRRHMVILYILLSSSKAMVSD